MIHDALFHEEECEIRETLASRYIDQFSIHLHHISNSQAVLLHSSRGSVTRVTRWDVVRRHLYSTASLV
jgi:hypothetical protein